MCQRSSPEIEESTKHVRGHYCVEHRNIIMKYVKQKQLCLDKQWNKNDQKCMSQFSKIFFLIQIPLDISLQPLIRTLPLLAHEGRPQGNSFVDFKKHNERQSDLLVFATTIFFMSLIQNRQWARAACFGKTCSFLKFILSYFTF